MITLNNNIYNLNIKTFVKDFNKDDDDRHFSHRLIKMEEIKNN